MTRRGGTPAWRQVVSLLAAFGTGAVLVLVGGAVVPDLLRLPDPPPALASPWARGPDGAPSGPSSDGAAPAVTGNDGATEDTRDTPQDGDGDRGDGGSGTARDDAAAGDDQDGRAGQAADPDGDDARIPDPDATNADGADPDGAAADAAAADDGSDGSSDGDSADATAPGSGVSAQVLALVAAERAAAGCPAPRRDPALDDLAAAHAADMRDRGYFDHTDPDGRTPWDRADAAGVAGVAAENIARGQADAAAVMAAWMDSPGHRANILDCSTTRHGVARAEGAGGPWWVQVFGR